MMPTQRTSNRKMFWRIIRRLLGANRGRLLVVLLALGSGAAITAALLNLQVDAKQRLTTEFRTFGANVIIEPAADRDRARQESLFYDSVYPQIPKKNDGALVAKGGFSYALAKVYLWHDGTADTSKSVDTIVAGFLYYGNDLHDLIPGRTLEERFATDTPLCSVGELIAKKLQLHAGNLVQIGKTDSGFCMVNRIESFGGPDDARIFCHISQFQSLFGPKDSIQLIQIAVPGNSASVQNFISRLQSQFPSVTIRPLRQFTEAEGKIYNRISGLLTATVGIVLLLTGLCVLAAMTNVAMERRNDVGLMKAIGGSVRRVIRFFLVEAALLGLIAGLLGAAAGIAISIVLGKAVFGVAAQPRLIVYPVAVALTIVVAILSSFPLRRLAGIRPASVFRGEA